MPDEILAHDWEILGDEDRIRRWPSQIGEKRGLKVRLYTWVGTCAIGATHFSVSIEEQNNMWWCEERNAWVELTCDLERSGISLSASLSKQEDAIKVALKFIEITGVKETHEISWDGPGQPKWAR